MFTMLVTSGEAPFDAADVREQIGLLDPSFDHQINAMIGAKLSANGNRAKTGAVWSVPRADGLKHFFRTANRIGKLVKIGPAFVRKGVTYHDCEYVADPKAVAKAFKAVCNWCWDHRPISNAILAERRGDFRPARVPMLQAAE